jgi:hypothetical protein
MSEAHCQLRPSLEEGTVDSCRALRLFDNFDSFDLYFAAVKITQKEGSVYFCLKLL